MMMPCTMTSSPSVVIVAEAPSSREITMPTTSATTMTNSTVTRVAENRSRLAVARNVGACARVTFFIATGIVKMPER